MTGRKWGAPRRRSRYERRGQWDGTAHVLGILPEIPTALLVAAVAITVFAGFVKGAVGFAMPMIMISGLGSILPAETALAALILPTLVSNLFQSLRQGWRAAVAVARRFWVFLAMMLVFLASSAQLVNLVPQNVLLLVIGVPIVGFALMQLVGWHLRLSLETRLRDELVLGGVAGFVGGMSGVWGPPLVAYLVAIKVEKREAIRAQGVIFGVGAVALVLAHLESGVLNTATVPLSAAMVVPAVLGLGLGTLLHDRMPQATFRRAMLVVLVVAGLNLVRRGLVG